MIDDIALQDPGVRVLGFAQQPSGPGNSAPVHLRMPRAARSESSPVPWAEMRSSAPVRKSMCRRKDSKGEATKACCGARTTITTTICIYAVYYRGEGEQNWRLLKDKLNQTFYSWDTTSMPDGAYYLKIVASDLPSNPPIRR